MKPCIICGSPTSFTYEGAAPAEHHGQPMCPACQAKAHDTSFTGCETCSLKKRPPADP